MTTRSPADRVLSRLEQFGTRLGLETTTSVLAELGDPHLGFDSVLVAGTNGKGSVAAMLSAIASAAGYATGLFTSPHLEAVGERIKLDGRPMEECRLGEMLEIISMTAQRVTGSPATYFESLFVASCCWFAEQQAELVIFEVGLGGRLDATNVNDPVLSVITEIGLEHQEQLGNSIESIAREKAGIMRRDRPVVVGAREAAAISQLQTCVLGSGAIWRWVPDLAEIRASEEREDWSRRVSVATTNGRYDIELLLAGEHQEQNLLTAVVAAEELVGAGWNKVDREAIESGVADCRWAGRLERVEVPERPLIILDAAHNPSAAGALAGFLRTHLTGFCLLFGVLEDKDVGAMLPPLLETARSVVLTRPRSARARDPFDLVSFVPGAVDLKVVVDPREALDAALGSSLPLVICGSIYLVGEVRQALRRRFGVPPPAWR